MSKHPPRGRGRRKGASDLFIHTRQAARERYGIDLTKEQHAELGEMVREKRGEFLLWQTGSRSLWKLRPSWASEPLFVVYQKPLSACCTVLAPRMVDQIIKDSTNEHYS